MKILWNNKNSCKHKADIHVFFYCTFKYHTFSYVYTLYLLWNWSLKAYSMWRRLIEMSTNIMQTSIVANIYPLSSALKTIISKTVFKNLEIAKSKL